MGKFPPAIIMDFTSGHRQVCETMANKLTRGLNPYAKLKVLIKLKHTIPLIDMAIAWFYGTKVWPIKMGFFAFKLLGKTLDNYL